MLGGGVVISQYSFAQVGITEIRNATLLREYFLPIQALAPTQEGAITIDGNECMQIHATDAITSDVSGSIYEGNAYRETAVAQATCEGVLLDEGLGYSPQIIPAPGTTARKTQQGIELQSGNSTVVYEFVVTQSRVYQLSLSAFNAADPFNELNRNDYRAIEGELALGDYPYADVFTADPVTNKELAARRLMFQVGLQKDVTNETSVDASNVMNVIPLMDSGEEESGLMTLGLLEPGTHRLYVTFANDVSINDATIADGTVFGQELALEEGQELDCGQFLSFARLSNTTGMCTFPADKNADGVLEKRPVITQIQVLPTTQTNDVIGVRVYTNPDHVSALRWYQQNLLNQGNPTEFIVDGYRGVLDERTAYINAANVGIQGDNAQATFYTNVYVIAHNVNASPQTVQIFNEIIENWKFNRDIIQIDNEAEAQKVKNRLRRDTQRLEHINEITRALEDYRAANGTYPDLNAGTFERGHVMSTWVTWQSIFGNELGALLPLDPLNQMTIEFYPQGSANTEEPRQYSCQDEYEGARCENICLRNDAGDAVWGCPRNQQCVGEGSQGYCSVIPPGYDAVTGWSEETQELWFNSEENSTGRYQTTLRTTTDGVTTQLQTVDGAYNTYGSVIAPDDLEKYKDDAFVYQYTTVDAGESYELNYRLEYESICTQRRPDGSCVAFANTLCAPGSCYLDQFSSCIAPGQAPYEHLNTILTTDFATLQADATNAVYARILSQYPDQGSYEAFKANLDQGVVDSFQNQYCFSGRIVNSCGNGILQQDAGETCEFNSQFASGEFCDARYQSRDWYNEANIAENCTTSCRLESQIESGQIPVPYNPQAPGLSCGGYCGDGISQFEFSEQCDEGIQGGIQALPAYGGSGGISANSQYVCTPATGVTSFSTAQLLDNVGFENEAQLRQVDMTSTPDELKIFDVWGYAPGVRLATNVSRTGSRSLYVNTTQHAAGQYFDVQENQLYTVTGYLRADATADNVSLLDITLTFLSHTPTDELIEVGAPSVHTIDLSALSTTSWTPITFVATAPIGVQFAALTFDAHETSNTFAYFIDDIGVTTTVGCQSFGGYCGDGIVQTQYGEQCDILSHIPPTPQQSVNQIDNGSFEIGTTAWSVVDPSGRSTADYRDTVLSSFDIQSSSVNANNKPFISSGVQAVKLNVLMQGAGIGQQVMYQPTPTTGTSVVLTADMRAQIAAGKAAADLKPEFRIYQIDTQSQTAIPFDTSQGTSEYCAYSDCRYLVAPLTTNRQGTADDILNNTYATFTAQLVIPPATQNNLNTGTLAVIALKGDGAVDGAVVTGNSVGESYFIDGVSVASNFRLNYSCTSVSGLLCQYTGGYCGDGVVQPQFGEECDLGGDNGGGIVNGQVCSNYCAFPFCGDGETSVFIDPNGQLRNEICDPNNPNDPRAQFCGASCTTLSAGAPCSADSECGGTAFCNAATGTCTEATGAACDASLGDSQCGVGQTCDQDTGVCILKLDVYLRTHLSTEGVPLSLGDDSGDLFCPALERNLVSIDGNETPVLRDACTGLEFLDEDVTRPGSTERATSNLATHRQARNSQDGGFRLPTVRELYSLVTPNANTWPYTDRESSEFTTTYTDNKNVRLCSLTGAYDFLSPLAGDDRCFERGDERYLYWSSTPYSSEKFCFSQEGEVTGASQSQCVSPNIWDSYYYAVDFKKATIDVLPPSALLSVRLVNSRNCGDGILQPGEQCEFALNGEERFGDGRSSLACSESPSAQGRAPYTAGNVHCDVNTCQLRFDNCVLETAPPEPVVGFCDTNFTVACLEDAQCGTGTCIYRNSCEELCSGLNEGSAPQYGVGDAGYVKSFGTNLTENYPGRSLTSTDPNRRPRDILDDGTFVYDDNLTGAYRIADDGLFTFIVGGSCGFSDSLTVAEYNQAIADAGLSAITCPFGFRITNPITSWGGFDAAPSGPLYTGAPESFAVYSEANQNAQTVGRTLCNCQVPVDPNFQTSSSTDDPQILLINEARVLVQEAEAALSGDPGLFQQKFLVAQQAVDELFSVLQVNEAEAIELQNRLDLLAEYLVIAIENSVGYTGEAFSRWTLDESIGRTSYNVGPGREQFVQGSGGNLKVGTIPGGTFTIEKDNGVFPYANPDVTNRSFNLSGDDYMYTDFGNINTAEFTMAIHYRLDTTMSRQTLWSMYDDETGSERYVYVENNQLHLVCDGISSTLGGTVVGGEWEYHAVVFSNNLATVYEGFQGGVQQVGSVVGCPSFDLGGSFTDNKLTFGAQKQAGNVFANFVLGEFEEIRVYYTSQEMGTLSEHLNFTDINADGGFEDTMQVTLRLPLWNVYNKETYGS
jgi:hypothetical protein